ncbi:MAG: enoyl-CoA hydratase/isomerase family protein [Planctomycetes bacterium]|nr:enoyl-CoA hydratase/isomerase family protein [Planctomycetota bacterium]MCB9901078.1 enoyl-CoA hydratase/isomerase family protein [Planctomycetota bacterium]
MAEDLRVERHGDVAHVVLDRPEKRNAFDDELAGRMAAAFRELAKDTDLRAVVLAGEGKAFCAGGDLAWMRRVAAYSMDENLADARGFQEAFEAIDRHPVPVIARVQGAAMGGGAGLVAAVDIAIAAEETAFAFPEVRLGLVPGVIAPYVLRAIGARAARHLFVTGERFNAAEALHLGLVHRVVPLAELDHAVDAVLASIRMGGPQGVRAAKQLVLDVEATTGDAQQDVARRAIATARGSEDGREGTTAFLEHRRPRWQEPQA